LERFSAAAFPYHYLNAGKLINIVKNIIFLELQVTRRIKTIVKCSVNAKH
jgi:hypothetical protein